MAKSVCRKRFVFVFEFGPQPPSLLDCHYRSHWDGQVTLMDGSLGWAGHRDGCVTGMGRLTEYVSHWEMWVNMNGRLMGRVGHTCQLHEQRRVPQIVNK